MLKFISYLKKEERWSRSLILLNNRMPISKDFHVHRSWSLKSTEHTLGMMAAAPLPACFVKLKSFKIF